MIIYLLTVLENISIVSLIAVFTCIIGIGGTTIASIGEYYEEEQQKYRNARKKFILPLIIATILSVLIPSKKDMATIYVLNNKDVQETLKNIPELTKLTTEFLIDNLKKE